MPGTKIDEAYIEIGTRLKNVNRDLAAAQAHVHTWMDGVSRKLTNMFQYTFSAVVRSLVWGAIRYIKYLTVGVVGGFAAMEYKAVRAGMAFKEAENLFEVTFKGMSKEAKSWADNYAKSLRLSEMETRRFVSTFFLMLRSMGFMDRTAYTLSKSLTQLVYDISSFRNIDVAGAFEKISSGIVGMPRPLQMLGILINEDASAAWALKHGLKEAHKEMDNLSKVVGRFGSLIAATTDDQGDLLRTLNSEENMLRAVGAAWSKMLIKLGESSMKGGGVATLLDGVRSMLVRMTDQLVKTGDTWNSVFRKVGYYISTVDISVQILIERLKELWSKIPWIAQAEMVLRTPKAAIEKGRATTIIGKEHQAELTKRALDTLLFWRTWRATTEVGRKHQDELARRAGETINTVTGRYKSTKIPELMAQQKVEEARMAGRENVRWLENIANSTKTWLRGMAEKMGLSVKTGAKEGTKEGMVDAKAQAKLADARREADLAALDVFAKFLPGESFRMTPGRYYTEYKGRGEGDEFAMKWDPRKGQYRETRRRREFIRKWDPGVAYKVPGLKQQFDAFMEAREAYQGAMLLERTYGLLPMFDKFASEAKEKMEALGPRFFGTGGAGWERFLEPVLTVEEKELMALEDLVGLQTDSNAKLDELVQNAAATYGA